MPRNDAPMKPPRPHFPIRSWLTQMLKALTPVATLAVGCAFGLERATGQLSASVGLITLGVMGASWGEGRFSGVGVAAMVMSVAAEALRLNIMQVR